jgi:hypothetical protein
MAAALQGGGYAPLFQFQGRRAAVFVKDLGQDHGEASNC